MIEKPGPLADLIESQPPLVRHLVKSVLGVHQLERLYLRSQDQLRHSLSQAALDGLNVKIDLHSGDLAKVPVSGPLVVVANHPFGLLDGLVLNCILERVRSDVKILANETICSLSELAHSFIPVDVFARRACPRNISAAREALRWLSKGGGVATFPSGTVSHWNRDEKRIADPEWHDFPVGCASAAHAPIVPIYFEGRNSLLFQLVGLVHPRLRTARLPRELLKKQGTTVKVRIGRPIDCRDLADAGDRRVATEHVRARVYLLRNHLLRKDTPSFQVLPIGFWAQEPAQQFPAS
jgi:putative hemolysin